MNKDNMKEHEIVSCEASFKKNAEYDFTFEGFSVWNGERYMLLSFGDEHAVTVKGCEAAEYVFRTKALSKNNFYTFVDSSICAVL